MNALQIYLVMQLDSLSAGLIIIGLLCICWALVTAAHADGSLFGDEEKAGYRRARRRLYTGLITIAIVIFIPSTKTMAAMLILPQIANSETIRAEAIELYQLAKDALRETQAP